MCVCIWEHGDKVFDNIKTANKETPWGGGVGGGWGGGPGGTVYDNINTANI